MTAPTARAVSAAPPRTGRNPGPSWGYRLLRAADRVLPETIYRPLRAAGTWVAVAAMPAQRRHSRDYLRVVQSRPPTTRDVFRHFFAFTEALMLKLRTSNGRPHYCELAPDASGVRAWLESEFPALIGTFHVGTSDLIGFMVGGRFRRRMHLVRLRVGNSHDIEALTARYAEWIRFIWVNEPGEMLFALKDAAAEDGAIALQCDRVEFSSRPEAFEFLGARRLFPFAIYELARVFERPVILTVGMPAGPDRTIVHDSPVHQPHPGESREAARARGRAHFQAFLQKLEALLAAQPHQWFNFTPLNPAAPPESV